MPAFRHCNFVPWHLSKGGNPECGQFWSGLSCVQGLDKFRQSGGGGEGGGEEEGETRVRSGSRQLQTSQTEVGKQVER